MNDRSLYMPGAFKRFAITGILERIQGKSIREMKKMPSLMNPVCYDDVEEELDYPYINRDGVPLAMDVFKPVVEEGTEMPVLIYVHGGGLIAGDRRMARNFARLLAHKGYLTFTLEYRLVPRANVCEQLDDLCAGLDILGSRLPDYDVDFGRIFLIGESAGAYLSTYVAAMKKSRNLQKAIGYEPSRIVFQGIGLISGMIYTQRRDPIGLLLSDQFYGDKAIDENFRKYMDPEHPEIIENLPPAFLITSRGDFLNGYTLSYHKALEKAGKKTHIVYYGEKELQHAFVSVHPEMPQSEEAIDKMLGWFEEQVQEKRRKSKRQLSKKELKVAQRIKDGNIREQKAWKYIWEINSANEDKLDAIALVDSSGRISYRRMFRLWERYAATFSGIGITGKNRSRVGLIGLNTTELIGAMYSLNMVGAMISGIPADLTIGSERWKRLVKEEGLTDLFIMDAFIDPKALKELMNDRDELGLKNVILVHVALNRNSDEPIVQIFNELNYKALRRMKDAVYWSDMLEQYEAYPISYCKYKKDEVALAVHTSGTTRGTHKPMFFSDFAWNAASHRLRSFEELSALPENPRSCIFLDVSAPYAVFDQLHLMLSLGATICETYFLPFIKGSLYAAVQTGATVVMCSASTSVKRIEALDNDLSHVKMLILGGGYVSEHSRKKINRYIKEKGGHVQAINGYGISEMGGACIISPSSYEDDSIGFPLEGINVRILDEENGQFYAIEDGPRTGTMYLNSDSMSIGKLDDKVFFETTMIDGLPYIDTFDLVRVNENGSLTYIGRSDRYFVNNEGVRFDAGKVDVALSSQNGVTGCALAPAYNKTLHDTIPVLYVHVTGNDKVETVRQAILKAYISNELIKESNLPSKCVITDKLLPYNANGKVDVYKITKGEVTGEIYVIQGKYRGEG